MTTTMARSTMCSRSTVTRGFTPWEGFPDHSSVRNRHISSKAMWSGTVARVYGAGCRCIGLEQVRVAGEDVCCHRNLAVRRLQCGHNRALCRYFGPHQLHIEAHFCLCVCLYMVTRIVV